MSTQDAPGPRSMELSELVSKVEPTELTRIGRESPAIFWERGRSNKVWDVDGNAFLDFTSAFGVSILGHSPPSVITALRKQADLLIHTMGEVFPTPLRADLCSKLLLLTGYGEEGYVCYLTQSGSEAIEVGIKALLRAHPAAKVIACDPSYHGQLLGALRVTGQPELREPFQSLLGTHITFAPYPESETASELLLGVLHTALDEAHSEGTKAVFIIEPMGNANGVLTPPPSFWEVLKDLRENGGLIVIFDEIYTGFGRSGAWLLHRERGALGDVVCVGKALTGGLPLAACIAHPNVWRGLQASSFLPLHGATYSSHPLCLAGAIAAVEELRRLNAPDLALSIGVRIEAELLRLRAYSRLDLKIRGRGLMWALEIGSRDDEGRRAAQHVCDTLRRQGILVLQTGLPFGNSVGMAPPLTVSPKDLTVLSAALASALKGI